jgi:hypothetical protein
MIHLHLQKQLHGRLAEVELADFYKRAHLDRVQHDRDTEEAIADLRAENARRRLQDQRDLDADYRNYVIPV